MERHQVDIIIALYIFYFAYYYFKNHLPMVFEEDRILLLILVRKFMYYGWMALLASFYANYKVVYLCIFWLFIVSVCLYFRMLLQSLELDEMIKYDRYERHNIIIRCPQAYGVTQVTPDFVEELLRQDDYDLEEPVIDMEAMEAALSWVPEPPDPVLEERYKGWYFPEPIARVPSGEDKFSSDLKEVIKALKEMTCCLALMRTIKLIFFGNGPKNE